MMCCSPEFLNRLDEIIVFRQLTKSEVKQIADIMLTQVFKRAEEKGIKIDVTGALEGGVALGGRGGGRAGWLTGAGRGRAGLVGWRLWPAAQPLVARLPLPPCSTFEYYTPFADSPPPPPHATHPTPPRHPLAERFKDRLVDEGYNPAYGARPLRRAIMRLLEDSMAERMLAGDIKEGDSVIIDGAVGGGGAGGACLSQRGLPACRLAGGWACMWGLDGWTT